MGDLWHRPSESRKVTQQGPEEDSPPTNSHTCANCLPRWENLELGASSLGLRASKRSVLTPAFEVLASERGAHRLQEIIRQATYHSWRWMPGGPLLPGFSSCSRGPWLRCETSVPDQE